jgi:hypothetical protein
MPSLYLLPVCLYQSAVSDILVNKNTDQAAETIAKRLGDAGPGGAPGVCLCPVLEVVAMPFPACLLTDSCLVLISPSCDCAVSVEELKEFARFMTPRKDSSSGSSATPPQ